MKNIGGSTEKNHDITGTDNKQANKETIKVYHDKEIFCREFQ